jgi:hypothetical protein
LVGALVAGALTARRRLSGGSVAAERARIDEVSAARARRAESAPPEGAVTLVGDAAAPPEDAVAPPDGAVTPAGSAVVTPQEGAELLSRNGIALVTEPDTPAEPAEPAVAVSSALEAPTEAGAARTDATGVELPRANVLAPAPAAPADAAPTAAVEAAAAAERPGGDEPIAESPSVGIQDGEAAPPDDRDAAAAQIPSGSGVPPELQPSPYGEGSILPGPDNSKSPHADYSIKGNIGSMLYHTPDSPYYVRTRAAVWFRSEEDALRAGFIGWNRRTRQPRVPPPDHTRPGYRH